ncbi:MAG: hypothetical protein NT062_27690, partial [Proteobacteria bacterium]|nr:hypothetical protein [Pseudomonadota bacterium]
EASCQRAGLPDAFCRRMGKQAFETDYQEWTDLAAHAQRALGEDRCTAADEAITRVGELGDEVTGDLRAGRFEPAAIALGRALHTIQDECAHHGITNQEHAFYSLTETCSGDAVSPDVQPAAVACAKRRTDEVIAKVVDATAGVRWGGAADLCIDYGNDHGSSDACANAALPSPFMACDFLAEYKDWDGEDSSWDVRRVGDALQAAFGAGLDGRPTSRPVCGDDPTAIDPTSPRAPVVVTRGALGCLTTSLGCFGKVDEEGASGDVATTGGCATSGPSGLAALAAFAVAFVPVRRRRARR